MPKIDNITYPDGGLDLLADSTLGKMYRAYLKQKRVREIYLFLDVSKKITPKKHYPIFFDDDGKYSINVDTSIKVKARELAEANNWKPAAWKDDVYDQARTSLNVLLQLNFQREFYKEWPPFRAHHARLLRKKIKIPSKLKQELAMEDDSLLADTVVLFMSDKKAGKKAAKALASKKKTPRSPTEVAKAIGKFFKVA